MKRKYNELRKKYIIYSARLEYFLKRTNQVYICMVKYNQTVTVTFGKEDIDEPYDEETELTPGIWCRKRGRRPSYVIHTKGKFNVVTLKQRQVDEETILVLYRPQRWEKFSRDEMLQHLFEVTSQSVAIDREKKEKQYEAGKISLEKMNEYIRLSNMAQFKIEKLKEKYGYMRI